MNFTLKPSAFDGTTVNASATQLGNTLGLERNTICGVMAHAVRRLSMHARMLASVRRHLGIVAADDEATVKAILELAARQGATLSVIVTGEKVSIGAGKDHIHESAQAWGMIGERVLDWFGERVVSIPDDEQPNLAVELRELIQPDAAEIFALGFGRIKILDHYANMAEIRR